MDPVAVLVVEKVALKRVDPVADLGVARVALGDSAQAKALIRKVAPADLQERAVHPEKAKDYPPFLLWKKAPNPEKITRTKSNQTYLVFWKQSIKAP